MPLLFAAVNVFVIAETMDLGQLIERYMSQQTESKVLYKTCKEILLLAHRPERLGLVNQPLTEAMKKESVSATQGNNPNHTGGKTHVLDG